MGPCIVNVFLSMTNKMQRCIILFIIVNALPVLSGFSARNQELKSVHAASGICQTCLLLPLAWMSWDCTCSIRYLSNLFAVTASVDELGLQFIRASGNSEQV
jgi:hypothetical protein